MPVSTHSNLSNYSTFTTEMPVSTGSRSYTPDNGEELRNQTLQVDVPPSLSPSSQDSALNNQRFDRNVFANRDVPISNIEDSSSVPPQTLLHQQMVDPELRELIGQLSESQSSILAILQSLTEPHSGENLNSLQEVEGPSLISLKVSIKLGVDIQEKGANF